MWIDTGAAETNPSLVYTEWADNLYLFAPHIFKQSLGNLQIARRCEPWA
jgi:hypothetical protein